MTRTEARCWDVRSSATLDDLLTWGLRERGANRMIVATRLDVDAITPTLLVPDVELVTAELFGASIRRALLVDAWPGTRLKGHYAKVFVVEFDEAIMTRMIRVENKLHGWVRWHDPPLPEDISVYREGDALPCLVSVTHEADAWIFHDGDVEQRLAMPARFPLPPSLIPPPPTFLSKM